MTTVLLDIIAVAVAPEPEGEPEPEPKPAPAAASSEVYVIHTAPCGRLDPSSKDLAKVEIVSALDDAALDTFIAKA